MLRPTSTGLLMTLALAGAPVAAEAQSSVEDPILGRGAFLVELRPTSTFSDAFYPTGSGSRTPLSAPFLRSEIGSAELASLLPAEERFRGLAGDPDAPALRLGAVGGRVYVDEQILPIRLSYGARDRITIGATFPLVRTRVDALLRSTGEGANVGTNPAETDPSAVNAFRQEAANALGGLRGRVDADCSELGEAAPECLEGRTLVDEVEEYLDSLEAAYLQEQIFPLQGTPLGALLQGRWDGVRTALEAWGEEAPALIPLAASPLGPGGFRTLALDPAWPAGGFPVENQSSFVALGDIELHLALPLPELGFGGEAGDRFRMRTAAVGTIRLATGEPDSLRAIAPVGPPRGVGGGDVRVVTDVTLSDRLAVLGIVSMGWNGSDELLLLAPDPEGVYTPGRTRAPVRWEPGGHLSVEVSPRVHLGPGLSLGGGWTVTRRGEERFSPLGEVPAPPGFEATSVHLASLELRYATLSSPLAESARFPLEFLLRASRSVAGSGAPVVRRVEGGFRVLLRR